jgi:hypothetical protein
VRRTRVEQAYVCGETGASRTVLEIGEEPSDGPPLVSVKAILLVSDWDQTEPPMRGREKQACGLSGSAGLQQASPPTKNINK